MTQVPPVRTFPGITAIPWLPAKEVLGGEASDFTPWLQQAASLEILGTALKLDDLTAIATEHNVSGKRLDILARALDEDGEEIPVCIENQYGTTDASHLGRLIAYLAQHERGRAVWIVEQAHDAFVAAVRFLNRTSTEEVGYYLVQVRFAKAPSDGYHVHFDVLAAPIAWEGPGRRGGGGTKLVNAAKVEYLEAIHELVRPGLLSAGFASMKTRGAYLWLPWPEDLWFKPYGKRLDIRVTRDKCLVALYVNGFATKTANVIAADIVRERLGETLRANLPAETEIEWEATGSGLRKVVRLELQGHGYVGGDVSTAGSWSALCCQTLLNVIRAHPIADLAGQVRARSPGSVLAPEGDPLEGEDE